MDRIDPRRFDVRAILDKLNAFEALDAKAQDAEEFGRMGYAGLDEAEHPFVRLVGEAHNGYSVVRDLDGTLAFLCETGVGGGCWTVGPFSYRLVSELELEPYLEYERAPFDFGVQVSRTELERLLDALPGYGD